MTPADMANPTILWLKHLLVLPVSRPPPLFSKGTVVGSVVHCLRRGPMEGARSKGDITKKPRSRNAYTSQLTEAIFDVSPSDQPVSSYVLGSFRMILGFSSGHPIFSPVTGTTPQKGTLACMCPFGHNFVSACEQHHEWYGTTLSQFISSH